MNKIFIILLFIPLSLFLFKCHSGEANEKSNSIEIVNKEENGDYKL